MKQSHSSALLAVLALVMCVGGMALADTYEYDRLGRLTTVTLDDSTQIAYTYDRNGNILTIATGRNVGTGVEERSSAGLPKEFALDQNYPNPFNPSTQIDYALPSESDVSLRVYDILGRPVATLVAEQQEPGWYSVRWDGVGASSGVYIARITAGGYVAARKMILMR